MSKTADLHKLITTIQDGAEIGGFEASQSPHLGLFYVVTEKLYWEGVPLMSCQDSSYFRIYPKIHPTFWNNTITKKRPELAKFDAYHFSRGRIIYEKKSGIYELVADKCINRNEEIISQIIREMKLPRANIRIVDDPHYECFKCKEEKLFNLESELEKLTDKCAKAK